MMQAQNYQAVFSKAISISTVILINVSAQPRIKMKFGVNIA